MGRKEYLKGHRSDGKFYLGFNFILLIISLFPIKYFVQRYFSNGNIDMLGFAGLIIIFWSFNNIRWMIKSLDMMRGEKSRFIKKNPHLLRIADEADWNIVYENPVLYITYSGIGAKKNPTAIARLTDVTRVVKYKKYIDVVCSDGSGLYIDTKGYKEETIKKWMNDIKMYFPDALFDYNPWGENIVEESFIEENYVEENHVEENHVEESLVAKQQVPSKTVSWDAVYQNSVFYITDSVIGLKEDILSTAKLTEVLIVKIISGNMHLGLYDGKSICFNIEKYDDKTVEEWIKVIKHHCPNVVFDIEEKRFID